MAVRRPLILDGDDNLIEMTDAQIEDVQDRCRYTYGANPSVTLSVVNSGGNLGALTETRLQAGAYSESATATPSQNTTADVSVKDGNDNDKTSQTAANTTASVDTNNVAFPIFQTGGNIQAMTLQDVYDTFIFDAIDTILSAVGQPGTYRVHDQTTLSGYTAVSNTAIFVDTRANASAYTAGAIPEALDQAVDVKSYYLLKPDNISPPSMEAPLFIRNSDSNLQQYSQAGIDAILENCMRHVASEETGSKIRYRWSTAGSGVNLGTGMADTRLNGSTYETRFVDADDYRAQEFPAGSATTISTRFLRMYEA
jgi:hypothetical protein